ncbi:hypothetical protein [Methylocaldum sp. GT1BB]|uniref:hypothetical protein n=1 Tax=Methylocaldum sp. GT1BB TaxID=3438963 RepID=UPI003DA06350
MVDYTQPSIGLCQLAGGNNDIGLMRHSHAGNYPESVSDLDKIGWQYLPNYTGVKAWIALEVAISRSGTKE